MFKYIHGSLSSLTGAAEPVYGKEAFHSIDDRIGDKNPYGKLTRDDLKWRVPHSSNVETETFYFTAETGHYGFFQVIHSNPVGLHTTSQFTGLVRHDDKPEESVWASTSLENHHAEGTDFHSNGCSITLNEEGNQYVFSSVVNEQLLVEVKITRTCEGFKIGEDGISYYGHDAEHPWGSMRHMFWPRCSMSGKIVVKSKEIVLKDARSMYVMALQGMKPHHAASRWNFLNFQGKRFSAVVMEFTTPASYEHQTSSVGCVVKDDKLLSTAVHCETKHLTSKEDEVGWPQPTSVEFDINGPKIDSPDSELDKNMVKATVKGDTKHLVDRMDVMAEIPHFLKKVASGVSGTKPYIYQYSNTLKITVTVDGETYEEEGHAFSEASFIS